MTILDNRKCGNCNGTGNIYKGFGGTAPGGADGTVTCNVCNGTGVIVGTGPEGQPGNKLPFLVFLIAASFGVGMGYLSYQNSSSGRGYDGMMTAILIGAFAFIAVGMIYRIMSNPLQSVILLVAIWTLDHFVLGGAIGIFLRNLFSS